jgi:shikimate kinase
MKNIILIGMPASGKSTIGVILAKTIKYKFIDTDLMIQNKTNKTLIEIINNEGIDNFLKIENDVLKEISETSTVISTGGSAVYNDEGMINLKNQGIVVYLKHRYEVIVSRLTNIFTRGIVKRDNQTFSDIFEERIPLYEKYADITIEADGLTIEQTIECIIDKVNYYKPDRILIKQNNNLIK